MTSYLKNSITVLFLVLIFFVGYIRETIFLVINAVLNKYPFPYNSSYVTPSHFLYNLSNAKLVILKYILTFCFSLLFFSLTILLVHFYFKNKGYNKLTLWFYAFLIGFSFLLSIIGILFNNFIDTYTFNRFIIGLAQTPLLPLVLFVLFYFKTKIEREKI
ncbi:MAG: hypothetical protein A3K10_12370 [Bacteroidetes bacterium RIFCSPLOWO2_12_FULL_31_6]|nr:MAG: hypothetical protein A3K10_12370 [Bacteroidetes bacterium RIFCSPLOWO2_12_FULL_31_6]